MSQKSMLILLSTLVMFGSTQAESGNHRSWNTGMFGTFIPFKDTTPIFHPGVTAGWSSSVGKYNLGADLRFTWPVDYDYHPSRYGMGSTKEPGTSQFNFVIFSITGRRSLYENNVAPIMGAGISLLGIYGRNNWAGDTRAGFGGHVTFGIDMFRHTKSRLRVEARVDVPFYQFLFNYNRDTRYHPKVYLVPVSIGILYHR